MPKKPDKPTNLDQKLPKGMYIDKYGHTRPLPPQNKVTNPLGRGVYSENLLRDYSHKPSGTKAKMAKEVWQDTAYVLASRAKSIAKRAGKLDYNLLYRLILSAGIAYDKAFPKEEYSQGTNVVLHLFGNLGNATVSKIISPPIPQLSSPPIAIDAEVIPLSVPTPSNSPPQQDYVDETT